MRGIGRACGKIYDCGCSATGGPNLPDYCPQHGTPPPSAPAGMYPVYEIHEGGCYIALFDPACIDADSLIGLRLPVDASMWCIPVVGVTDTPMANLFHLAEWKPGQPA